MKLRIPIRLLYSNRTEDEMTYRAELEELQRRNANFEVLHTRLWGRKYQMAGRIEGENSSGLLRKAARGLDRPVYYF